MNMAKNMIELRSKKTIPNNINEEFGLVQLIIENADKLYKKAIENSSIMPVINRDIDDYCEVIITACNVMKDISEITVAIYDKRVKEAVFKVELLGESVCFNSDITYIPEAKVIYEKVENIIKEILEVSDGN